LSCEAFGEAGSEAISYYIAPVGAASSRDSLIFVILNSFQNLVFSIIPSFGKERMRASTVSSV
jgi:hypothetical protein